MIYLRSIGVGYIILHFAYNKIFSHIFVLNTIKRFCHKFNKTKSTLYFSQQNTIQNLHILNKKQK